jgi:hypothetical protein
VIHHEDPSSSECKISNHLINLARNELNKDEVEGIVA